ncbi:MAG: integrase [Flavobacteriaceae bacterium]|nr:integrase [Flavobacteriaceae bacterium]|tara:strand:- start:14501 stop:15706 length:1206 start_codon:yes stop_codon:yes gene_type:complete
MKSNKLSILFLFQKSKINRKGEGPIRCRLTYNKKRKVFSTGIFIKPDDWNKTNQEVDNSQNADYFNKELNLIKTKLYESFLFLQVNQAEFTLEDIYRRYKGESPKKEFGVVEVYNLYLARVSKLIAIEIKQATYDKYVESLNHLKRFIKWKFNKNDFELRVLKASFLEEYEYYLKTEPKLAISTLNKAIQRFRRVIKYAISEEYLLRDPFVLYKPKKHKKKIIFLTDEELKSLEKYIFKIKRLERVKDMFVFCCYTGLAFKEMANLKKTDINKGFDGKLWVNVDRSKSGKEYRVPLLPNAKKISEKYKNHPSKYVLPDITNQNFNAYLKEIASVLGIEKRLTHHIARKTFATTVLLANDVPMEIVSKLLGHSKIQTTQDHYGQILERKIGSEMARLKDILD